MRTPAGKECSYFFGDYYRGRNHEECRLLASASPPQPWSPSLCSQCPVPDILNANACSNLLLQPRVQTTLPLLRKAVRITASCSKTGRSVEEPKIGCGECHPLPDFRFAELDDANPLS
jgi:hypothetical protein